MSLDQLDVPGGDSPTAVASYRLDQNYPNPFNGSTVIPFEVRQAGKVSLKVYDVNGRLVQTLLDKNMAPGTHNITFNAEGLASGTYFVSLKAGEYRASKKMVYLK